MALPDEGGSGGDPGGELLEDCDAVARAIEGYAHVPAEHKAEVRRTITRRHVELGCNSPLPSSWRISSIDE